MSQFDFILVAYSIVLGVGLATLLANVAWLIRERDRVGFSWIHAGWVVVTLLWLVAAWWDVYVYREKPSWSWADFVLLMLGAVFVVLQALLVAPTPGDVGTEERVDLDGFWVDHRAAFLGAAILYWGVALVRNLSSQELQPAFAPEAMISQGLLQFTVLGLGIWRREKWLHVLILSFFLLAHVLTRVLTAAGSLGAS